MLQNIKDFYGYKLAASDGEIGQVKDFEADAPRQADPPADRHLRSAQAVTGYHIEASKVFVGLSQADIRQAAEDGLAKVHVH